MAFSTVKSVPQQSDGKPADSIVPVPAAHPDLRLVFAGALVLAATMFLDGRMPVLEPIHLIFGLVFTLYVPGSLLVAAVFPDPDSLDKLERLGLGVALSIAIVPLLAFVLSLLPWGVRDVPITIAEGGTVLLLAAAAVFRRSALPKGAAFRRRESQKPSPGANRFYVVLGVALVLAGAGSWWTLATPAPNSFTTEFYVLGKNGAADNYPRVAWVGQPVTATVGIVNRERAGHTYRVEVWVSDGWDATKRRLVAQSKPFSLRPLQSRQLPVSWQMPRAGDNQEVEIRLLSSGEPEPYRQLRLWLNVKIGVPSVDLPYTADKKGFTEDVPTWWANHPLNPHAPGGIPIGGISNPSPMINLPSGGDLNGTMNSSQCASGCTIVLADGGTYGAFSVYARSHIHVIANTNATIKVSSAPRIAACPGAADYADFAYDVFYNTSATGNKAGSYNNGSGSQTARQCFANPVKDFYFKNITWDGSNATPGGLAGDAVRDVVCDRCTFQNFPRLLTEGDSGPLFFNMGSNNVWCRGCHFIGNGNDILYFDGMHGGGVIDSTIENNYYGPVVVNYTNDDFTEDLNNDGYVDLSEQRGSQFLVYEGNTFNSSAYSIFAYSGSEVYIHNNTVNGNIPGNGTQNYPFAIFIARCSNHLYAIGTQQEYHNDGVWVVGNTINGSAPVLVQLDTAQGDTAQSSCQSYDNPGTVGQYRIDNNTVTNPPSYYQLLHVISSNIPLDTPNEASGNSPAQ